MGNYCTPEAFVFNDGNSNNALMTAAMMNGGGFGGGYNSPFWALIMLAFLRQWGWDGNGYGGNNGCNCLTNNQLSAIQETLNTNQGNTLLMNAITGNATSIKELASVLNCNYNAVQTAINGIQSAICNLGSKNDMNAMQIVNAINGGNASLANQLSSCCCDVKQLVTNQGYENRIATLQQTNAIQDGFSQIGYANAENTCAIKTAIDANGDRILARMDMYDKERMQREINALTAENATIKARAERAAEKADTDRRIDAMACKLPNTVPVAWPQLEVWQRNGYYDYGRFGGQFG